MIQNELYEESPWRLSLSNLVLMPGIMATMATMHRAFAKIPAAAHFEARDQALRVLRTAFGALDGLRIRTSRDLFEVVFAFPASVFMKRHG
jgi:hypothetical protein